MLLNIKLFLSCMLLGFVNGSSMHCLLIFRQDLTVSIYRELPTAWKQSVVFLGKFGVTYSIKKKKKKTIKSSLPYGIIFTGIVHANSVLHAILSELAIFFLLL